MIIAAYKKKGYAKRLKDIEYYTYPTIVNETYFPGRTVSPQTPITTLDLTSMQKAPSRPSARAVRSVSRFLLRRVGIRLIPIIGWGILAKDIYDIATD